MNTDIYLDISSVPAGAILYRIVQQKHISQITLAQKAKMIPQRINDLIMGRRRFTPQISFMLEQALGITSQGFFYKIQANHDIYQAQLADSQLKPDLNILTTTTFWDVDLSKLEWMKCQDWAIRRVLEYGSKEEIEELYRFYGHDAFVTVKENHKGFMLYEVALENLKTVGL